MLYSLQLPVETDDTLSAFADIAGRQRENAMLEIRIALV